MSAVAAGVDPREASRRGACPTLDAPMQTGDGLLIRLLPASRALQPPELEALCRASESLGNGIVEVTSRGSLQFRGFTPGNAYAFAEGVAYAGIVVRTGLVIDIDPLAGLDPQAIADPRPVAEALRASVENAGLDGRLAPKTSVVIDGGGRSGLRAIAGDIRLEAAAGGLWALSVAGDAARAMSVSTVPAQDAVAMAIWILERLAALGKTARAMDLLGTEWLAALALPAAPTFAKSAAAQGALGEPMPLSDARVAVACALPFGRVAAFDLGQFATTARGAGIQDIRPAPGRRLILVCAADRTDEAIAAASGAGLIVSPTDPRLAIDACTGAPRCASGRFETLRVADEIASLLSRRDAAHLDLTIHVSGCAKGCARQRRAALTLVGGENGVGLVVNGTAQDRPAAYTDAGRAAQAALAVIDRDDTRRNVAFDGGRRLELQGQE